MKRLVLGFAALLIGGVSIGIAQEDALAQRKANFKAMGAALRDPGGMLRGATPFDLAKVQTALALIAETAEKNAKLFPTPPPAGAETEALPVIWEKKADFEALFAKMAADARAAQVSIKDEATLKSELPKVLGNCGTCHNTYRVKRS